MNRHGVALAVGVGALVTVCLSFIPFSSVLGGIAATSRRDGGYLSGLGLGAATGVVAILPLGALFVPAIWITGFLGYGISPDAPAYDVFLAIVGLLFVLYTVGLSAFGGAVGVWVRGNTDWNLDPMAWL